MLFVFIVVNADQQQISFIIFKGLHIILPLDLVDGALCILILFQFD